MRELAAGLQAMGECSHALSLIGGQIQPRRDKIFYTNAMT